MITSKLSIAKSPLSPGIFFKGAKPIAVHFYANFSIGLDQKFFGEVKPHQPPPPPPPVAGESQLYGESNVLTSEQKAERLTIKSFSTLS